MFRRISVFPCFLALLCFTASTLAQPLTGTKTIGGTTPDYPTIHAAICSLNVHGIATGGVTFRIRHGTYNEQCLRIACQSDSTRQVFFTIDSGATVLFSITPLINDSIGLEILSNYVSIDGSWRGDSVGRHLTFQGDSLMTGICFNTRASHNTLKNCNVVIGHLYWHTAAAIQFGKQFITGDSAQVGNKILNCDIVGGYDGICFSSQTHQVFDSVLIRGCNIYDFNWNGIAIDSSGTGIVISQNRIYSTIPFLIQTNGIVSGSGCLIERNKIGPLLGRPRIIGIYMGHNNTYSCNMIVLGEVIPAAIHGFFDDSYGHNKLLFNTVWIHGRSSLDSNSTGNSTCYYSDESIEDTLWGNVFFSSRIGPAQHHSCIYFYSNSNTFPAFSDYNLYYTTPDPVLNNCFMARSWNLNPPNYLTLADFRRTIWAPRDSFSFWEQPHFMSVSDLHIRTNVPTHIESGAPHHWQVPYDFDGELRTTPRCDIGADEGSFTPLTVRNEIAQVPQEFRLEPVYPNPFNSTTTIRFSLPVASQTKLELFDINGRLVTTLQNSVMSAGSHRIQFDGSKLASGMYFVRMSAGKFSAQQKMVLLR